VEAEVTGLSNAFKRLADKTSKRFVIAILGDSTATEPDESPSGALKTFLAAKTPERAVTCRTWSVANGKLNDQTIWQQGSGTPGVSPGSPGGGSGGGGTVRKVVFSDTFNRGGPLTAAELIGSTPEIGNAWAGPTGWYRTYNNAVGDVAPGVTPDYANPAIAKHLNHDGKNGRSAILYRLDASKTAVTRSRFYGMMADTTTIFVEFVLSSTSREMKLYYEVPGEPYDAIPDRELASFPADAMLAGGVDQFVNVSIDLTGKTVTATISTTTAAGVALTPATVTGTLTDAERATIDGWDGSGISSNDPRFRYENHISNADITTAGTGTSSTSDSGTPGSGPQASVYNLSIDGSVLDAQMEILDQGLPLAPDVIIIQHGLNYGADTPAVYLAKMGTALGTLRDKYPSAEFAFVIENPRFPMAGVPASRVTDHAARNLALPAYLKLGDIAYADTFADWTALADGGASLVIDDKHPNTAGRLRQNTVVRAMLDDAWSFGTTPVDPADDIPEPITFGTVIWRAQEILPDGVDADLRPDVAPVNGRVILTPDLSYLLAKELDIPRSYLFRPIELSVRNSRLYGPDGSPNVRIVASNSPALLPTEMHWTARFYLEGFPSDAFPPVRFRVPGGANVDLTLVTPSNVSPRVEVAVVDMVIVNAAVAKAVAAGTSATTAATGAATSASSAAASKSASDINRSRAEAAMVKAEAAAGTIGEGVYLQQVRPGAYLPVSG
jgi:hypothetical protein